MTTATTTLTDWLLACITDDEAVARANMAGGPFGTSYRRGVDGSLLVPPARVLAECEAKRRIVERHRSCDDVSFGDQSTCPDLCDLALPYADRPGYQEAWRP